MLGGNITATDHSLTVALSVLGGLYGTAVISALIFIILPRLMGGQAAGRSAAGLSRAAQLPRSQPRGIRWSPSYGRGMVRTRPGAYLPRNEIEMQRVMRVSAAPNCRFPAGNRVWLYYFVLFSHTVVCGHKPKLSFKIGDWIRIDPKLEHCVICFVLVDVMLTRRSQKHTTFLTLTTNR